MISSYDLYERELTEEGLTETVLANVNVCRSCANCKPGWEMTFFGMKFENVCHNVPVRYANPGEKEIKCIKRVLELMRETVGRNK